MQAKTDKAQLSALLAFASKAVSARTGGMPWIMSGVQLSVSDEGVLSATGSDLEIWTHCETKVEAGSAGAVVVPSRLFSEIVRSLPAGPVEISKDENDIVITAAKVAFNLRLLPDDQYPSIPQPGGTAATVSTEHLATALKQVNRAASSDDSRPVLTGVLFEKVADGLRFVATDSYRLAMCDIPDTQVLDDEQVALVPSSAVAEVVRMAESAETIDITLEDTRVFFDAEASGQNHRLITTLIQGDFPAYGPLIPSTGENNLIVDREDLLMSVKRLRLIGKDYNTPLKMTVAADDLLLEANTQDVGNAHENLPFESYDGSADLAVAFGFDNLIDGLEAARGDSVEFVRLDPLKATVLKCPDDPAFKYLLMPVRLS